MSEELKYKLILSDLDGTLIVKGQDKVPDINKKAITEAREKGVKFVICSARSFKLAKPIMKEIGSEGMENEYSCLLNGALIVENTGKIIKYNGISFDLAKEILEFGKKYDVMYQLYDSENCYIFRNIEAELKKKELHHEEYIDISWEKLEDLKDKSFGKVLFCKFDLEYLKNISKEIYEKFGDKIEIAFSANRYLEMNPKGVTKGNALKMIAEFLNIDMKNTIAIGDDFNDVTMIDAAGLGCYVANAKDALKEHAKYVSTKNFEEGGVAEIIQKFVLE